LEVLLKLHCVKNMKIILKKIKMKTFCRTFRKENYLKVLGSSPSYLVTTFSTLS